MSKNDNLSAAQLELPTFAFQWHITDACDQRCKHCYIFSEDGACNPQAMSFPGMKRILAQIQDMAKHLGRAPYIYVTGGDPLLHPDFWKLAELLHEKNLMWAIMGNPFHVDEEVAQRLKKLGCRKYQVSLDGLEATHDNFRMTGSFARTLDAIKTLKAAGIWATVMTTVSSANAAEIPRLIDLVAELEVDVFAFGRYCPTSDDKASDFHMTPAEYREFLLACQERIEYHEQRGCKTTFQRKDHLWKLLEWEQGKFVIPEASDPEMIYDGCHCGHGHITITPNGDVYGCRRMHSLVGNTEGETLEQIFLGYAMEQLRDFDRFQKCVGCELFAWCRGCPAVAKGYTGDMYAADPQCWKEVA